MLIFKKYIILIYFKIKNTLKNNINCWRLRIKCYLAWHDWVYNFSCNIKKKKKSNKSHNGQGWGRCTKNKRQWVVGNRWMKASKLLCVEILFKIRLGNPVIQHKPAHLDLPTIWLLFKQIRMLTNVVQPHWLMVVIIYYTSYSHAHQPHHILYIYSSYF